MKSLKFMILVVISCMTFSVMAGCTTPAVKSEVALPAGKTSTIGDKVRLFHSGNEEIQKVFCVGDVIPVYKEVFAYGVVKRNEVGKIKVLSYAGSQSIIAEVVEGTVKSGNIAEKEATACMVYFPETE